MNFFFLGSEFLYCIWLSSFLSSSANIPVTIVNEDVITQGGEVYSVLDEQNVNVVVYAKRSVIQQISSDEIVATADIKEMDAHTGLIPIKITIPSHSGEYQSAEASPRNIQIKTEKTGKAVFRYQSVRQEFREMDI